MMVWVPTVSRWASPSGAGPGLATGAPLFACPLEVVWRVIYTTSTIESLHVQLRKIIKNRGHFPGG